MLTLKIRLLHLALYLTLQNNSTIQTGTNTIHINVVTVPAHIFDEVLAPITPGTPLYTAIITNNRTLVNTR